MQEKPFRRFAAVAVVALALVAGSAQARDNVFWSIGIDAAPGVSLGVSNARPVVIAPAPVYVAPQPVYVAPVPMYYTAQPVVLVQPAPVFRHPGKHKGWRKHHHRKHRHWD